MDQKNCIGTILEERGVRKNWFAEQLSISPSYLTLLLNGERRWTEKLKDEAERILMIPRSVLFFELDYRQTDDKVQQTTIETE